MNTLIDNLIDNSENLIDSIQQGACVVFIGSGFYSETNQGGLTTNHQRLEDKLFKYLKERENDLGIRAYENGWFHFKPNYGHTDAYKAVKKFYTQPSPGPEKLLEKLILLPTKLYLSLTPDSKIVESFDSANIPTQFSFYLKDQGSKSPPVYKPLEGESPIVYNQLGYIDAPSSLILTYDDFYDYLKAIFKNKSMDGELKEYILEAEHFIFLGIPFDMWYVPLFMRILSEYHQIKKKTKYAVNQFLDDTVITHSHEQYTMTFVKDVGIKEFVESLFTHFRDNNLLRSFDYKLLTEFLNKGEFDDFFDHIFKKNKTLLDSLNEFKDEPDIQAYLKKSKRKESLDSIFSESQKNLQKFIAFQQKYLEIIKKETTVNNSSIKAELKNLRKELNIALIDLKQKFPNCTMYS